MRLKYALYPNPFRKKEYMASVQPERIYSLDDVLKDMSEANPKYSAEELRSILALFLKTIAFLLKEGSHIHLPWLKITFSISGKFRSEADRFDDQRHRIQVNVNPGKELRTIAQDLPTQKVKPSRPLPQISRVYDFASNSKNQVLTPGRTAEVRGKHLRFDRNDPQQGLFLRRGGVEHKFTDVVEITTTRIWCQVPSTLPPGTYELLVRSTVGNSTEVRSGYALHPLQLSSPPISHT